MEKESLKNEPELELAGLGSAASSYLKRFTPRLEDREWFRTAENHPPLARAAELGVPSAVLQGTRGLEFRLRGDRWGLYRYIQGLSALARRCPDSPALPFWYLATDEDEKLKQDEVFRYIESVLDNNSGEVKRVRKKITGEMLKMLRDGFQGDIARDIPCIQEPLLAILRPSQIIRRLKHSLSTSCHLAFT